VWGGKKKRPIPGQKACKYDDRSICLGGRTVTEGKIFPQKKKMGQTKSRDVGKRPLGIQMIRERTKKKRKEKKARRGFGLVFSHRKFLIACLEK